MYRKRRDKWFTSGKFPVVLSNLDSLPGGGGGGVLKPPLGAPGGGGGVLKPPEGAPTGGGGIIDGNCPGTLTGDFLSVEI